MQTLDNNNGGLGGGRFWAWFLICLVLLLVWQYFFAPPMPDQQTAQNAEKTQTASQTEDVTGPASNIPISERVIETAQYSVTLTNAGGGRASSIKLKEPDRYSEHGEYDGEYPYGKGEYLIGIRQDSDGNKLPETKAAKKFPFAMSFGAFGVTNDTPFTFVEGNPNEVRLQYADSTGQYRIEKTFRPSETVPYMLEETVTFYNQSSQAISQKLVVSLFNRQIKGQEASLFKPGALAAVKCFADGDMEDLVAENKGDKENYTKKVQWIAADESYFAVAMQSDDIARCDLINEDGDMTATMDIPIEIAPQGTVSKTFKIYMGPKESEYLKAFGHDIDNIIDYGWIEILAKPMSWLLAVFHGWTGNWGVAIIILTLIIRLLLWPVAQSSQESMLRMSKLTPLLQEIQEKYKDDPQTMQQKQIELYKEHKVNPFGCLPLLLQMPVFFALYRTIFVTGGLYNAKFILWIKDLSSSDPYFVLPILTIVVFVLQQLTSQSKPKTTQQKIMIYGMPLFFGLMMIFLPSGLCLYMFVSSLFSVLQSFYTRHKMKVADEKAEAASAKAEARENAKQRRAAKRRQKAEDEV